MENKLVVGILDIVENKLREFGIQIPDADREDSTDPLVGYQYAELHDQIQEYLEAALPNNQLSPAKKMTIHTVSLVNSEGYWDGSESIVESFISKQDCLDVAYQKYESIWKEAKANDVPDLPRKMSKKQFEAQVLRDDYVVIQFDDHHVQVEVYEQELDLVPQKASSLDDMIRSAAKEQQNQAARDPGKTDDLSR